MSEEKYESSWAKFHKSGRGEAFGWGLIFLWAALVVLIETTVNVEKVSWWDGWAVFFVGFGVIALTGAIIWAQIGNRDKAGWNFVVGAVALGFSLSVLLTNDIGWVVALGAIAIGLVYVSLTNNWDNDEKETKWC